MPSPIASMTWPEDREQHVGRLVDADVQTSDAERPLSEVEDVRPANHGEGDHGRKVPGPDASLDHVRDRQGLAMP
jgi:hypothetical protein